MSVYKDVYNKLILRISLFLTAFLIKIGYIITIIIVFININIIYKNLFLKEFEF